MTNKLLAFAIIFLTFACSDKETDKRLFVPFIESYELLSSECSNMILETLEPYGVSEGDIDVKGIYYLNIRLNDSIYSKEDSIINQFIGILYEPDSLQLDIFCFNKIEGTVSPSLSISNKDLIINNNIKLSVDLKSLQKCNFFNFDKKVIEYSRSRKNILRVAAMDTKLFGTWERNDRDKKPHHTEFDNGKWEFLRENKVLIISNLGDTIINDNFKMQGYELDFENSECPYEILSTTKKAIVFLDINSNSTVTFYRKK